MRHEAEIEDMEVETDPTPVGVGSNQGVSDTNVEGSGVKRDAERSIADLEAEMEADLASGTMIIDLFLMDDACQCPRTSCMVFGTRTRECTSHNPGIV